MCKQCVIEDRVCSECGECDICDLDSNKLCDNCCKCIDSESDYKTIDIDEVIEDDEISISQENEISQWKYGEEYEIDYSNNN